jgi:hypothetical protein
MVVDLEGLEEFADGHLLVTGRQERFMPLPLGRQLVEPGLVDLLGGLQVGRAAGLDVLDPVPRERTKPVRRASLQPSAITSTVCAGGSAARVQ